MKLNYFFAKSIMSNHVAFLGLLVSLTSVANIHAQILLLTPFSTNSSTVSSASAGPEDIVSESLAEAKAGHLEAALAEINPLLAGDRRNKKALLLRAILYGQLRQWEKSDADYAAVLDIDPNNATANFDRAELLFLQQKYDGARTGFAETQKDPDLGDLATYKVFLCDLFAGHEVVASQELEAINSVGENPSYYFANAAWDLVHKKPEDASDWLKSAARIYASAPQKCLRYAASLRDLGYLPQHFSSTQ
jgi:tetratricopeptide (TPR) repeat protein